MTEAHTSRAHARLAPSAAHRWMSCPGSVKLSAGIPDTTSSFAAEGSAAHELCEKCLRDRVPPETFAGQWVDLKTGSIVDSPEDTADEHRFFEITDEMVDAVGAYVEHVNAIFEATQPVDDDTPFMEIEQRLDMTHLHPEIFGTGDAVVYDPATKTLHVVDFKYGKGVAVDADDNPQLLLYATGAARRLSNRNVGNVVLHIVQPRAAHAKGSVRSYPIDVLDLFEFEDRVEAAARATESDDAALNAGDWCRFCKAMPICPKSREKALRAAADEFGEVDVVQTTVTEPAKLSADRMAALLKEADFVGNYVKAVQEYAHAEATAGRMPTGFKLVAKRAVRKWKDEAAAVDILAINGASDDDIYTAPKLKSPAQLESFFPGRNKKEREAAMADLVVKQSNGTNLVPDADPRPAVQVGANADFEPVE